MAELVIMADDMTGALDTGVQFSKNDINTLVALYTDIDFSKVDKNVQVIVVDTESRHIPKEEAATRIGDIARKALMSGVPHFYKKTDSALRGNVGSELLALMEATDSEDLMFIPAYPDTGRTTLNCCQFINGVPIDETSFARDPVNPVTSCYIPHIIKNQADIRVEAAGRCTAANALVTDNNDKKIFVFDADNNIDMRDIARFLKTKGKLKLTAGCAGFANSLLEVLNLQKSPGPQITRMQGRMLTVCGSMNETSVGQVKCAEANGFSCITLEPCQISEHDFCKTIEGKELTDRIAEMLDQGKDLIIKTPGCVDKKAIPSVISRNIGRLVGEIASKTKLGVLTVFGGDTAAEVVNALGLHGIMPRKEILPGVVLSDTEGNGTKVNLITKSGGFGEESVIIKIKEYMSALER